MTLLLAPAVASAQLNGNNLRGDFGVGSGTQPAPGVYLSMLYVKYDTDDLRNKDGERVPTRGEVDVNAFAPVFIWVTPAKVLGANLGGMAAFPVPSNAVSAPLFDADLATGFANGDLYLQPLSLGWRTPRADFVTAFGLYTATGRYAAGADNNTGLGMTTVELSGGTTVYFDEGRSWSAAATGFWETHSEKKDTETRVGDLLTIEGGIAKSFFQGGAHLGAAYYAQWKLTADEFGARLPDAIAEVNEHKVFGLGPDVTLPLAVGKKLIALINARALWEFGARSTTQGRSLIVTATFPVPSIAIP